MKKNKYLLIYLLLLTIIMGCSNEEKSGPANIVKSDKENLVHLKEVLWPKAYAEQDTVLLDQILGDDFQMIDQVGNWYTKQDEINWIKKHATKHDSFHYEIKRLDIYDNGTAIVCGTGHILNDSVKSIYQSSNVLQKRSGKWKAVLSHVSGAKVIEE